MYASTLFNKIFLMTMTRKKTVMCTIH